MICTVDDLIREFCRLSNKYEIKMVFSGNMEQTIANAPLLKETDEDTSYQLFADDEAIAIYDSEDEAYTAFDNIVCDCVKGGVYAVMCGPDGFEDENT